jgi:hypothetical protein
MDNASIQKWTPGTSRNRHSAATFIKPKISAGAFLRPLKNLSEITPENIVPIIPQTELMEMIKTGI